MKNDTMKHLAIMKDWNKTTRHEKIVKIIEAHSAFGKAQVEYLKGRTYLLSLFLSEGNVTAVDGKREWNQVRIEYRGKTVLKILDSGFVYGGYLFDEHFSVDDINRLYFLILGFVLLLCFMWSLCRK